MYFRTPELIFINVVTLEGKLIFIHIFLLLFSYYGYLLVLNYCSAKLNYIVQMLITIIKGKYFLGECFCVELTQRGWRICSDRQDCMYGDFRKVDMHARYFDTIYALLDSVSPKYREKFAESLSEKLQKVDEEASST